jgi:hypothetical protein
MRASQLIAELQEYIKTSGDLVILIPRDSNHWSDKDVNSLTEVTDLQLDQWSESDPSEAIILS